MTIFTRRHFCLSASALLVRHIAVAAAASDNAILLTAAQAAKLRATIQRKEATGAAAAFGKAVEGALKAGPWSVTAHRPQSVPAGPHDYYSEGPYWWPDPKNPSAPYIRKDGERNPARFVANHNDLGSMSTAVLSLGLGAYFLGDSRCAARAATVLSTWFLDAGTRMNANLEFGQAVHGHNTGRGTGLIDTVSFIHAVQGIRLLELAGGFDAKIAGGVRQWFADFLRWMTTSSKGLDEKKSGNNHATWWTAQVAAYASFTDDAAALAMAWDHYRSYLVPAEIEPDGRCPREEARTNSLGYSTMNLDAFAVLCRIAEAHGVDLWTFKAPSGVGVEKAFAYLMPYLQRPETWRKQQISKFSADSAVFPGLAGIGLHSPQLLAAYAALPRSSSPWAQFIDLLVKTAAAEAKAQ